MAISGQPDGARLDGLGRPDMLPGDDRHQQLQHQDQSSQGHSGHRAALASLTMKIDRTHLGRSRRIQESASIRGSWYDDRLYSLAGILLALETTGSRAASDTLLRSVQSIGNPDTDAKEADEFWRVGNKKRDRRTIPKKGNGQRADALPWSVTVGWPGRRMA